MGEMILKEFASGIVTTTPIINKWFQLQVIAKLFNFLVLVPKVIINEPIKH